MNAVEIEEAVSRLAEQPFAAAEFPYAFLEAFGNKPATLQRLRSGGTNQSDIAGVLQRGNIHIKTCTPGQVADLRAAHERNDETLERIYIGRRFKNDTERLEKLFELYTKMTANAPAKKAAGRRKA
jgi:hypothetical protein